MPTSSYQVYSHNKMLLKKQLRNRSTVVVAGLLLLAICGCTMSKDTCSIRHGAQKCEQSCSCGERARATSSYPVMPTHNPDSDVELWIVDIKRLLNQIRPLPIQGTGDDYDIPNWLFLFKLAERLSHEPENNVALATKEYVLHFQTAFDENVDRSGAESKVWLLLCALFNVPDTIDVRNRANLDMQYGWGLAHDQSKPIGKRELFSPIVWEQTGPRFANERGWIGSGPPFDPERTFDYLMKTVGYRHDLKQRIAILEQQATQQRKR